MNELVQNQRQLITAIVEIAILAIAFYAVLSFIRGTRGAGVFRGVLVFVVTVFIVVMWVTQELQLLRIRRILEWFLSTSLLALIVIFWPELRRALIQLGRLRILRPFAHPAPPPFLDAIAAAAERLSRNRIGALVAVEGDMSLTPYAEEGVPVDAAVSPELLETIFYPRSALHDGAVIIQHGRVLAAGCLFPLTESPDLAKSLGTRHRAAIGLSEETDSIIVVVSEETGRISLAERGTLTPVASFEQLRSLLQELYTGSRALGRPNGPVRVAAPHASRPASGAEAPAPPVAPAPARAVTDPAPGEGGGLSTGPAPEPNASNSTPTSGERP
jgi:diadenylate cyclase